MIAVILHKPFGSDKLLLGQGTVGSFAAHAAQNQIIGVDELFVVAETCRCGIAAGNHDVIVEMGAECTRRVIVGTGTAGCCGFKTAFFRASKLFIIKPPSDGNSRVRYIYGSYSTVVYHSGISYANFFSKSTFFNANWPCISK